MRHRNIARTAGWIAVAFGVIHIVVAPLEQRQVRADIFEQGPSNTISLEVTPENLRYSEAFWVFPASFGVPVLLLGAFTLWMAGRGERVPAPFGWAMIALGRCAVRPACRVAGMGPAGGGSAARVGRAYLRRRRRRG